MCRHGNRFFLNLDVLQDQWCYEERLSELSLHLHEIYENILLWYIKPNFKKMQDDAAKYNIYK